MVRHQFASNARYKHPERMTQRDTMAYPLNDAVDSADEYVAGLAAAYPSRPRAVLGGLVGAAATRHGSVAVLVIGGSGSYPAFGELVGAGRAHGAALGNIFALRSAQQAVSVASAVEAAGGHTDTAAT
jgi:dihydroxyacetone kinase